MHCFSFTISFAPLTSKTLAIHLAKRNTLITCTLWEKVAGFYIIYYFPLLLSITLFQVNGAPLHLQIGTCTTKVCTGNKTMKYIHNKSHNDDGQCWWWLKFSYGFNRCPSKSLRAIGGFELCWLKIYCRPTGVNHWDNYELILFTLCSCTVCHCSLPDILLGVGSVSHDYEKLPGEMISIQCRLILYTSKGKLQVSVANQQDVVQWSCHRQIICTRMSGDDDYIMCSVHDNTVKFSHKLGPYPNDF